MLSRVNKTEGDSMNVTRVVGMAAATILLCITSNQSQARLIDVPSYQQMLAKSDLVVIATPQSKTTDTREQAFLPNIMRQDKNGTQCLRQFSVARNPYQSKLLLGAFQMTQR
jgi:hypothetical protein